MEIFRSIRTWLIALLCAYTVAAIPNRASAQNLVTNPGAENGVNSGTTQAAGWNNLGTAYTTSPDLNGTQMRTGQASFSFKGVDASSESSMGQAIATTVGDTYDVSFWTRNFDPNNSGGIFASFGGTTIFDSTVPSSGNSWTQQIFTGYVATSTSTQLKFYGFDANVDDISVVSTGGGDLTTTPEPTTYALLGTGLIGLVPFVRRRRST